MSRGEDPHVAQSSHFLCGMGICSYIHIVKLCSYIVSMTRDLSTTLTDTTLHAMVSIGSYPLHILCTLAMVSL